MTLSTVIKDTRTAVANDPAAAQVAWEKARDYWHGN